VAKGEVLEVFFAHVGHVRRRHLDEQTGQALCLTLTSNAVVHWNSVYLQLGLDQLRSEGHPVIEEAVAHLPPPYWSMSTRTGPMTSTSSTNSLGQAYGRSEPRQHRPLNNGFCAGATGTPSCEARVWGKPT
jgi:hypothetical protein